MRIVSKLHTRRFQHSLALNKHSLVRVDKNIGDGGISKQWFERTKAKYFIQNLLHQTLALLKVHRRGFAMNDSLKNQAHLAADIFTIHVCKLIQIQFLNQLPVNSRFDGSKIRPCSSCD